MFAGQGLFRKPAGLYAFGAFLHRIAEPTLHNKVPAGSGGARIQCGEQGNTDSAEKPYDGKPHITLLSRASVGPVVDTLHHCAGISRKMPLAFIWKNAYPGEIYPIRLETKRLPVNNKLTASRGIC
jgi:hypothetical protein